MVQQPPPPPYGQNQPSYPYPPQPPRKRRIWPWVLIGGLILLCGGCFGIVSLAANDTKDSASSTGNHAAASGGPAAPAKSDAAPLGTEVRDGKFGFVVTGVEAGVPSVGTNPYLKKDAQGKFVLVRVTVTNTGNKPQTYFGQNQKLIDSQGRQFTNDTTAEINVNDSGVIGAEINPGNKLNVVLVFDVSPDAEPAQIEFHDSAFSGGARASLR
ncbi:DUF4352 domain-containing protein [Nocardia exalbida]|uniref:DUF4352 domain-containing protein n=1 Tax=Nocardia exalbida TaxID=290231 RepID=UPI0007C79875|nr:DUF4352 domain-containing protein [Nocardia exalbida]